MNRLSRTVNFTLQAQIVTLFGKISFGAAGAPSLDTNFSKGFCNVTAGTIAFTGTTDGSTAVVTAVSSFAGLYVGMTVTGTGVPASTTISSMSAGAGTVTLSANTTQAHTETLTASGGRYVVQLGQQAGVRLDTYNHLMCLTYMWDQVPSQGNASTLALAPNAPEMFMVGNNTAVITIPGTSTSPTTDATFTIQFGSGNGTSFVAGVPNNGDAIKLTLAMARSSAI